MKHKGVFIAIEGSDGAGKATQLKLLADHLTEAGFDVETFSFPRYEEPSSYFVREYLAASYGSARHVSPYVGSLFYALDRYQSSREITEALDAGKVVLADRFTASNMAHQGSKLKKPDQRKGFYMWVDGVEAQMLGIPRPDKSVVLHLPPEISRELMEKEGKNLDEHESDRPAHVASTDTFEELCKLFPQDFTQIDCVRSGALLSKEAIHHLIWGIVEPLLPEPSKSSVRFKKEYSRSDNVTYIASSPSPSGNISWLLAAKLGMSGPKTHLNEFYTPTFSDTHLEELWLSTMQRLRELHDETRTMIISHLTNFEQWDDTKAIPEADQTTLRMLPMSTLTNVEIPIGSTIHDDLAETRIRGVIVEDTSGSDFTKIASTILPQNHASASKPVRLVTAYPRNELDLLPEMLFEYSNLSITQLREEVSRWNIRQKQDALIAYVKEHRDNPNSVLSEFRYTFEIIADYPSLFELINAGAKISSQDFTPRYGYDIPKLIEEAGATAQYERSFDLSTQLFSMLQASGYQTEAQYATLLGHKQQYLETHNVFCQYSLNMQICNKEHQFLDHILAEQRVRHPYSAHVITA